MYIHKYLVQGRDSSYFVKTTTLILPKRSLKLISSTCSSCWLITYVLCLVDVFFNRQSAYLWVQTVPIFLPICSYSYEADFIHGFLKKLALARFPNFTFNYIDDVLSLSKSRCGWFRWSHLLRWAWNKGYHRYR